MSIEEKLEEILKRLDKIENQIKFDKPLNPYNPRKHEPALPTDSVGCCPKCNLDLKPVMGYCCPHDNCPCGLGGVTCYEFNILDILQTHDKFGSPILDETYPLLDGEVLHTFPCITCGWVFLDRKSELDHDILVDLAQYSLYN